MGYCRIIDHWHLRVSAVRWSYSRGTAARVWWYVGSSSIGGIPSERGTVGGMVIGDTVSIGDTVAEGVSGFWNGHSRWPWDGLAEWRVFLFILHALFVSNTRYNVQLIQKPCLNRSGINGLAGCLIRRDGVLRWSLGTVDYGSLPFWGRRGVFQWMWTWCGMSKWRGGGMSLWIHFEAVPLSLSTPGSPETNDDWWSIISCYCYSR